MLAAWLIKISTGTTPVVGTATENVSRVWYAGADIGVVPGYVLMTAVAVFYGWLIHIAYVRYRVRSDMDDGVVHV